MEWVASTADPKIWTAEIKTKNGILLSPLAVSKHLEAMRVGARLYGMEATIEGRIIERKGALCLAVSRSKEILTLAPLTRIVQWDVAGSKASPLSDEEKAAFARLKSQKPSSKILIRVTGTLTQTDPKSLSVLEVRSFQTTWLDLSTTTNTADTTKSK